MHLFLKCPKIESFHFRFIFCFKIGHVLFLKYPTFLCSFFKCLIFPISESDRKNGTFKKTNIKSGLFQKKHVLKSTNFKTEKKPKMKLFDFGHFKNKCICYHVKNISLTCFLVHFIIPPVYNLYLVKSVVKS